MYISSSIVVAALASLVHAQSQTPNGFRPSVNTKLELMFNNTMVRTPGQLLPKATTMVEPRIAIASNNMTAADTFMFVMLDLDVPPAQGSTTRRVLLHALNTGFKATRQRVNGSATILRSPQKGPAAYLAPGPPATDTIPHRYVQLLFKEPATLNVRQADFANATGRFNFDINTFMTANRLEPPIAGNFFTVDGRANSTTGGGNGNGNGRPGATGTGGGARPTTVPFLGGAERRDIPYGLLGGVVGLVVFAL